LTARQHADRVLELLRGHVAAERVERGEMLVQRRREERFGRRLLERAPQPLPERRFGGARREGAAEVGQTPIAECLCGPHDGRVARSEASRDRGGGEQRFFGAELGETLGHPSFGRGKVLAAGDPRLEIVVRGRRSSSCYIRRHSRSIRYEPDRGVPTLHTFLLIAASFLACAVEMVEALTIVLAVAVTRGWRSAGWGVAAALAALAVIVAALGPALAHIPIDSLRVVIGVLLLVFGLQWLRKAILRASGLKALHDEAAIYEAEIALLNAAGGRSAHDWYAFTLAFKGVFLEGLEVAFIIVTFGGAQHHVGLAVIGAAAALVAVLIAGAVVHGPLTRVPENTLKFGVGVMLTSFGIFWSGEGTGVAWPGGDVALIVLIGFVVAMSFGFVRVLRGAEIEGRVAPA